MTKKSKESTVLHAPAKVNLTLEIIGRNANGYHMLDSLMGFTDFGDTITLDSKPSEDTRFSIKGDFSASLEKESAPQDNLILRAIDLMRENELINAQWPDQLGVTLEKNIPVAAGLGGGSIDAAMVMRALMGSPDFNPKDHPPPAPFDFQALPQNLREDIIQILGAEMPVCLQAPGLFYIQGLGEIVSPVPESGLRKCALILFNPKAGLSTKDVFNRYKEMIETGEQSFSKPNHQNNIFARDYSALPFEERLNIIQNRRNDLQKAAFSMMPALHGYLDDLSMTSAAPLLARMSGSGATLFALHERQADAEKALKELRQKHPECWVTLTHIAV